MSESQGAKIDNADLYTLVKATLARQTAKAIHDKGASDLIHLPINEEGLSKCSAECIYSNKEFVMEMFRRCGLSIPRTKALEFCFGQLDHDFEYKVSCLSGKAARKTWARFNAENAHYLLTYSRDSCFRSDHSRSVDVCGLHSFPESLNASNAPTRNA